VKDRVNGKRNTKLNFVCKFVIYEKIFECIYNNFGYLCYYYVKEYQVIVFDDVQVLENMYLEIRIIIRILIMCIIYYD